MKKALRQALSLGFGALMTVSAVACGGDDSSSSSGAQKYNTETRPVVFSIGALDQKFNPFFSTSATDSEIVGMTQIGMLVSDANGDPACGDDQPTVALDYEITYYNANGNEVANGDINGTTKYEFVIKNGIKFSDGNDLTIDDVLFNLYVYLDPAYAGSSTIYSTKIKGLNAYRQQRAGLSDDAEVDGSTGFTLTALERIYRIKAYCDDPQYVDTNYPATPEEEAQVIEDLRTIKDKFYKELNTDWTNNLGAVASEGYSEYTFTEDWQSYLLNAGLVTIQTETNDKGNRAPKKDANGKYVTSLDDPDDPTAEELADYVSANWEAYKQENDCTEEQAREAVTKEYCINLVYTSYCDGYTHDNPSDDPLDDDNTRIPEILDAWATGSEILALFTSEARSDYFASIDSTQRVKTISGITTRKTNNFNGKDLGDQHDVLTIVINGVDPKALWNFGFSVAPMHIYSSQEVLADKANYPYGVKTGDADFFNNVLQSEDKNGLPVGAGVYKASNDKGGSGTIDRTTFYKNNVVYFQRNEYFDTVGGDEIYNAKIKYLNYKVVNEANIMNTLKTGDIDYGQPNAKQSNIDKLKEVGYEHLDHTTFLTGGYGYVGINPKFVPSVYVRRAIMKAMNRQLILQYYGDLAELIHRPMSKTSWAYPKDITTLPDSVAYTSNTQTIIGLLEMAGYTMVGADGVRYNPDTGEKLDIKLTIAGETTDHPAYTMFDDAANTLRECGFKVTVGPDIQALKKLATGGMAVWAAAWSSALDPDMYQVYHKDSTATSVKNWNYDEIKDPNSEYNYERNIVTGEGNLSDLIEAARATNSQDDRIRIYKNALNLVMDLAVELPTYQRNDLVVFNTDVIDASTLNKDVKWPDTVISKLWALNFN